MSLIIGLYMMSELEIKCDMDGVIADFAGSVRKIMPDFIEGVTEGNKKLDGKMWAKITKYQKNGGEFWYDLEPMKDAFDLWAYISKFKHGILSACGEERFNAEDQKRRWLKKHFGNVDTILVRRAVDKALHAAPNRILIDDKRKALDPWIAAGGIGVLHTSAADTISQLKAITGIS
jgi:phosphoglycolate phosphatase-like HAD superfamily hydrolase